MIRKAFIFMAAAGLLAAATVIIPGLAIAQEAVTVPVDPGGGTVVSVGPFWDALVPYILAGVGGLITAIFAWIGTMLQRFTGVKLEEAWQASLHSAAMTGVTAALDRIGQRADSLTIDVRHQIVADAVRWVQRSVPDAVKGLGADAGKIQEIVSSKLGVLAQAPPAVEVGKAVPHAG